MIKTLANEAIKFVGGVGFGYRTSLNSCRNDRKLLRLSRASASHIFLWGARSHF